ncbi:metallophosphoesterase [Asanoa iriomotensis]|uniref:Membrane protein n=1 Tax=Asanoa iriomotensis TaxID=234613 RepID=A0ABQ4C0K0_9ACTN|nr:metallophosphoesterase [Asanoa iriomotensis]GIF56294.1 membrane protein [Asanoa iriomotensis]
MGIVLFVGFAFAVIGLIHFYLWKRLVKDTTRPGKWRRVGALATLVLGLLVPATLIGTRLGVTALAWPGYLWIALMFYLLVVLALLEIPMLVTRIVLRNRATATVQAAEQAAAVKTENTSTLTEPPRDEPNGIDRRLLLARGAAIFAGLTATGITAYGTRTALSAPRIDRVQINLAKLPRSMDGFRIATVSDIHLGPLAGRAHAQRVVDVINRTQADLVAVVGDLVDGSVEELGAAAAPLRDIQSRHGAFFVTGNHEYYSGAEEWLAEVERLGIRTLRNQRQLITAPGGAIDLAGVNDVDGEGSSTGGPDIAGTLRDRDRSIPVVLLAHQPVQVHEAAEHGVDLQLSGHTHGGQMVPFNYLVRLEQPVIRGYAQFGDTQLYVTNGAGFWGPPVRVGAPPQVTLVELRTR